MSRLIELPNITLVAVATQEVGAAVKALDYSQREIAFGDCMLVSHENPASEKPYRYVQIAPFSSVGEWGRYVVFDLVDQIETEHILLIHEDGFVVTPSAWDNSWLGYDFIGAPFPLPTDPISFRDAKGEIVRVGNSVSLRSRRLLELPREIGLKWENFDGGFPHEDGFLCVQHRYPLMEHGINYAPLEVAARFGREVNLPEHKGVSPFVFHKWVGPNRGYPCFNPAAVRRKKIRRAKAKLMRLIMP